VIITISPLGGKVTPLKTARVFKGVFPGDFPIEETEKAGLALDFRRPFCQAPFRFSRETPGVYFF
jgi:hypothetical protein